MCGDFFQFHTVSLKRYKMYPRYMQSSEKQIEKLLPGVNFGPLATGARVGMICNEYGSSTSSLKRA